jgi:hypothetical protein
MGLNDMFLPPGWKGVLESQPAKKPPGVLIGNAPEPIYISNDLRMEHLYIIGRPRQGKSDLMKNLMIQDAQQGFGFAFIDPHGDAAEEMLGLIPKERVNDVIYYDPADPESPTFNVLRLAYPPHKIAKDIASAFRTLSQSSWGPRLQHILTYGTLTLLFDRNPHCVADIRRVLVDEEFRESIMSPEVESFWRQDFKTYPDNAIGPVLTRFGELLIPGSHTQRLFTEVQNDFDFDLINQKKILICNLAKGNIGSTR